MPYLAVTNNPKIKEHFHEINREVIFVEGHAKDVMEKCSELVYGGLRLAADPLAGYFSRPNPYHTVFLEQNHGRVRGDDLVRLQKTLEQWDKYGNIILMTERLLEDYKELDRSIALCTWEGFGAV